MELSSRYSGLSESPPWYPLVIFFSLLGGGIAYFSIIEPENSDLSLLLVLGMIQLTPFVLAVRKKSFNYGAIILASHFYFYTFNSKFVRYVLGEGVTKLPEIALESVRLHITCTVVLFATYCLTQRTMFQPRYPNEPYVPLKLPMGWMAGLCAYTGLAPWLVGLTPHALHAVAHTLPLVTLVVAVSSEIPGRFMLTMALQSTLLLAALANFITSGYLGMTALLVALVTIRFILNKQYKFLIVMVAPAYLLFQINALKGEFRGAVTSQMTATERAEILSALVTREIEEVESLPDDLQLNEEAEESDLARSYARVTDDSTEWILEKTPSIVPYWEGETYESLYYLLIPRFIFPQKPTKNFNNKFGKAYGVIQESDTMTNISINYLAEGFMNFGLAGSLGVAILMGFMIAFFEYFGDWMYGRRCIFPFLLFIKPLIGLETDLAHMVGELAIIVAGALVMRYLFLRYQHPGAFYRPT